MVLGRSLSTLAVLGLAAAALLAPTAAQAKPHGWASTSHSSPHVLSKRAKDGLLTWTVKDHKAALTSTGSGTVTFVYTCGDEIDPVEEGVQPGIFQVVYNDGEFNAGAFDNSEDQVNPLYIECDGTQHTTDWSFTGVDESVFQNGNGEVGLSRPEAGDDAEPTFEHVQIGGLLDSRASVAVTVNATPEPVKKGKTVTVKGTIKRDGKAYTSKKVDLFYQQDNKGAVYIRTVTSDKKGNLKGTVSKVKKAGYFFWVSGSTSKTQQGASTADHVAVK